MRHARSLFGFLIVFGVFASLAAFSESAPMSTPSPSPVPSASASNTVIESVPSPPLQVMNPSITPKEGAQLRKEFRRILKSQMKSLEEFQRRYRRESASAQKQRFEEWTQAETQARRKFFDENVKGAIRREYMKDLIQRRKALLSVHAEEEKRLKDEHAVRKKALESEQATRLKEFDQYLKAGQRPPDAFWQR